ncbi:MAG: GFA family protein [Pseudomonadota bacterium]
MADAYTGSCLCGAVKLEGLGAPSLAVCHCQMCRRWHGGPSIAVNFTNDLKISAGSENLSWYDSSEWAERGFCKICGSTLLYKLKNGSMISGESGTFDLPGDLEVSEHFFIDEKPDFYDFTDNAPRLTGAEVFAKYAGVQND